MTPLQKFIARSKLAGRDVVDSGRNMLDRGVRSLSPSAHASAKIEGLYPAEVKGLSNTAKALLRGDLGQAQDWAEDIESHHALRDRLKQSLGG